MKIINTWELENEYGFQQRKIWNTPIGRPRRRLEENLKYILGKQ
jgi:hypothetical protein